MERRFQKVSNGLPGAAVVHNYFYQPLPQEDWFDIVFGLNCELTFMWEDDIFDIGRDELFVSDVEFQTPSLN